MTFDQAYKEWITDELNEKLHKINENVNVKSFEDSAYHVLYRNPNAVCLILNGGNATHSAVEGVDQNVMPCTISIVCKSEYKTAVLNAMNAVQAEYNAVQVSLSYYDQITKEEKAVICKSTFNTPFEIDERDTHTKNGTVKAVYLQMSVSVIYGENAVVSPDTFELLVYDESGDTCVKYPISHIESYNLAAQPSYDEFVAQGEDRTSRRTITRNNTYNFSIFKVEGDALNGVLKSEIENGTGLSGRRIVLRIVSKEKIVENDITFFSLAESYVNHAAAYNLTLGV